MTRSVPDAIRVHPYHPPSELDDIDGTASVYYRIRIVILDNSTPLDVDG